MNFICDFCYLSRFIISRATKERQIPIIHLALIFSLNKIEDIKSESTTAQP